MEPHVESAIIKMPSGDIVSPLVVFGHRPPFVLVETLWGFNVIRAVYRYFPTPERALKEYNTIVDALLLVGEFLED